LRRQWPTAIAQNYDCAHGDAASGEMNAQSHDLAKRDAVSVTAIIRRAIAREIALASR
jgi:hypothetical protein